MADVAMLNTANVRNSELYTDIVHMKGRNSQVRSSRSLLSPSKGSDSSSQTHAQSDPSAGCHCRTIEEYLDLPKECCSFQMAVQEIARERTKQKEVLRKMTILLEGAVQPALEKHHWLEVEVWERERVSVRGQVVGRWGDLEEGGVCEVHIASLLH